MIRLSAALVLETILLGSTPVRAGDDLPPDGMSAAELGFDCRRMDPEPQRTCRVVIYSVLEMHGALIASNPSLITYCPPKGAFDLHEVQLIFAQWESRNRPRTMMISAPIGILAALHEAAPCRR